MRPSLFEEREGRKGGRPTIPTSSGRFSTSLATPSRPSSPGISPLLLTKKRRPLDKDPSYNLYTLGQVEASNIWWMTGNKAKSSSIKAKSVETKSIFCVPPSSPLSAVSRETAALRNSIPPYRAWIMKDREDWLAFFTFGGSTTTISLPRPFVICPAARQ